ncbi:hypothetical protein ABV523_17035 [Snodgrassella alvi]|uniref:hypothetical protein n=1 Tax=Snodgrassella TaxID=1193515 RepID=UPI000C1EDA88|nr:hypothetical protein [Snodgrassella alvi]PIT42129.1 hypothetical protein BHC53_04310 [Snodgrassella alvi]
MKTAKSNRRLRSFGLFILIYIICQAIVFLVRPVWRLIEKFSYLIDDFLNYSGIALADGEFDPAGLWVIFGMPLLVAFAIFSLIKKFR